MGYNNQTTSRDGAHLKGALFNPQQKKMEKMAKVMSFMMSDGESMPPLSEKNQSAPTYPMPPAKLPPSVSTETDNVSQAKEDCTSCFREKREEHNQ